MTPLLRPIICVVTRGRGEAGSPERLALVGRLAAAAASGASMIQVRERQLDDRQLASFVSDVRAAVAGLGTAVVVNDRIDVAIASRADGVHLKSDAPDAPSVRRLLPAGCLVGRSVHSEEEACAVTRAGGCDYLVFGTVYPSSSKPDDHPAAGLDVLSRVCGATVLPVIAIGGITVDRAAAAIAAGAAGVAAISLFGNARDMGGAVAALRDALTVPRGNV